MKSTKGEWTIELVGMAGNPNHKMIMGHPNPKDFQVIRTIGRLFDYGTAEENEANAKLIAAAPNLLDAIKQIKVLNAGKDCDISWLCDKAIKLVGD